MNDNDRDNLNFILSLDENGFEQWSSTLSAEDFDYAISLLKMARSEVMMKAAEYIDDVEDLTEANKVLKGFML